MLLQCIVHKGKLSIKSSLTLEKMCSHMASCMLLLAELEDQKIFCCSQHQRAFVTVLFLHTTSHSHNCCYQPIFNHLSLSMIPIFPHYYHHHHNRHHRQHPRRLLCLLQALHLHQLHVHAPLCHETTEFSSSIQHRNYHFSKQQQQCRCINSPHIDSNANSATNI